jgi:hypothetical protein
VYIKKKITIGFIKVCCEGLFGKKDVNFLQISRFFKRKGNGGLAGGGEGEKSNATF